MRWNSFGEALMEKIQDKNCKRTVISLCTDWVEGLLCSRRVNCSRSLKKTARTWNFSSKRRKIWLFTRCCCCCCCWKMWNNFGSKRREIELDVDRFRLSKQAWMKCKRIRLSSIMLNTWPNNRSVSWRRGSGRRVACWMDCSWRRSQRSVWPGNERFEILISSSSTVPLPPTPVLDPFVDSADDDVDEDDDVWLPRCASLSRRFRLVGSVGVGGVTSTRGWVRRRRRAELACCCCCCSDSLISSKSAMFFADPVSLSISDADDPKSASSSSSSPSSSSSSSSSSPSSVLWRTLNWKHHTKDLTSSSFTVSSSFSSPLDNRKFQFPFPMEESPPEMRLRHFRVNRSKGEQWRRAKKVNCYQLNDYFLLEFLSCRIDVLIGVSIIVILLLAKIFANGRFSFTTELLFQIRLNDWRQCHSTKIFVGHDLVRIIVIIVDIHLIVGKNNRFRRIDDETRTNIGTFVRRGEIFRLVHLQTSERWVKLSSARGEATLTWLTFGWTFVTVSSSSDSSWCAEVRRWYRWRCCWECREEWLNRDSRDCCLTINTSREIRCVSFSDSSSSSSSLLDVASAIHGICKRTSIRALFIFRKNSYLLDWRVLFVAPPSLDFSVVRHRLRHHRRHCKHWHYRSSSFSSRKNVERSSRLDWTAEGSARVTLETCSPLVSRHSVRSVVVAVGEIPRWSLLQLNLRRSVHSWSTPISSRRSGEESSAERMAMFVEWCAEECSCVGPDLNERERERDGDRVSSCNRFSYLDVEWSPCFCFDRFSLVEREVVSSGFYSVVVEEYSASVGNFSAEVSSLSTILVVCDSARLCSMNESIDSSRTSSECWSMSMSIRCIAFDHFDRSVATNGWVNEVGNSSVRGSSEDLRYVDCNASMTRMTKSARYVPRWDNCSTRERSRWSNIVSTVPCEDSARRDSRQSYSRWSNWPVSVHDDRGTNTPRSRRWNSPTRTRVHYWQSSKSVHLLRRIHWPWRSLESNPNEYNTKQQLLLQPRQPSIDADGIARSPDIVESDWWCVTDPSNGSST